MTNQEILDLEELIKNKALVAQFMGAKVTYPYDKPDKNIIKEGNNSPLFYYVDNTSPSLFRNMSHVEVKYDSSWDWLIPVWSKINNKYFLEDWQNRRFNDYVANDVVDLAFETIVIFLKENGNL